jgi:hypothetical protein
LQGAVENPLLKAFKTLRNTLDTVKGRFLFTLLQVSGLTSSSSADFQQLDAVAYLTPFLNIIHSEEANGPITGVALSSVHKFLTYGFISKCSLRLSLDRFLLIPLLYSRELSQRGEGDDAHCGNGNSLPIRSD